MTTPATYDRIGTQYDDYRSPDPRIAALIESALGDAQTVLNVGAGAGSYESVDRQLLALEPSRVMIDQRPAGAAAVVQGCAEQLPFASNSFDAVQGVLTIHHWGDQAAGLREVCRVARKRVVFLSWIGYCTRFWLFDYFPEIESMDHDMFPTIDQMESITGSKIEQTVVPVPADCQDGFMCAYWARPHAYLDPGVRSAISSFSKLDNVEGRVEQLRHDLQSGSWHKRYGELLENEGVDYGYRVLLLRV